MPNKLESYRKKRNFSTTPEPQGKVEKRTGKDIFVIQQHHASHMHYDLRLEVDGVLKSWAVPKGPSTDPRKKQLAMETEDHPIEYANFEGIIPEGYGAGTVIVWDKGTYENVTEHHGKKVSMSQGIKNGHIKIELRGKKLNGAYALTKFQDENKWLLVKVDDEYADARRNPVKTEPKSVISNNTIEKLDKKFKGKRGSHDPEESDINDDPKTINNHQITLSHLDKIFYPKNKITKKDVIDYYEKIAPYFLAHVKDHPIVMHRFPDGIKGADFYQKQVPDSFPNWIKRTTVPLKKGEKQILAVIDDTASLVYMANQAVLVFHSWLSTDKNVNKPTKIVFDLDPEGSDLKNLRFAAKKLKLMLEKHGLTPFIMTTGSRGYHIVAPIVPEHTFETVHAFAKHIANELAEQYSDKFTVEMNKAKRKGRIFIDYLRNSYGQTSVACYSLRAKEGAPIATPLEWSELSKTKPQQYTIKNIFKRLARKKDPWKDFEKKAKKLIDITHETI